MTAPSEALRFYPLCRRRACVRRGPLARASTASRGGSGGRETVPVRGTGSSQRRRGHRGDGGGDPRGGRDETEELLRRRAPPAPSRRRRACTAEPTARGGRSCTPQPCLHPSHPQQRFRGLARQGTTRRWGRAREGAKAPLDARQYLTRRTPLSVRDFSKRGTCASAAQTDVRLSSPSRTPLQCAGHQPPRRTRAVHGSL